MRMSCIILLAGLGVVFCIQAAELEDPFAVTVESPGSIKERRHYETVDVYHFTLNNGAEVLFKSTDVASTPVFINAVFPGGLSLLPEATESGVMLASQAVSATGWRGVKDSALANLFNLHQTAVQGRRFEKEAVLMTRTVQGEVEFALRTIYIMLGMDEGVDPEVLEVTRAKVTSSINATIQQPGFKFAKATANVMWPGRRFGNADLNTADLDAVDTEWVNRNSRALFTNVNGAWFMISGPLDLATVEDYAAKYIGGLGGGARRPETTLVDPYARESAEVRVALNPQDKSMVQLFYMEPNLDHDDIEGAMVRTLHAMVLSARLEKIRVKEGLVYGIRAIPQSPSFPNNHGGLLISFAADPKNVATIEAMVAKELKATGKKVKRSELDTIRKNAIRSIEQAWEQPAVVVASVASRLRRDREPLGVSSWVDAINAVSRKDVQAQGKALADRVLIISEFLPEPKEE